MGKSFQVLFDLVHWFQSQKRVLPWRNRPTWYRVWISEIMLQQTQVRTVIPYFENFLSLFPDVKTLAQADEQEVLKAWAGLGYYSRARNLQKGAKAIIARGGFPKNRKDWEAISGVGPYTAGAILSIAGNQPEAILDGNVERVLSRLRCVSDSNPTEYKKKLWKLSEKWVKDAFKKDLSPSDLNQALMELGALVCTPRNPDCSRCPIRKDCHAQKKGCVDQFPLKKKRRKSVQINEEVWCLVNVKGQVLLRKRKEGEWRSGLWDFPETELLPLKKRPLGCVETKHIVTHHKILRRTKVVRLSKAKLPREEELTWVNPKTPEIPFGAALHKTFLEIEKQFPGLFRGGE